MIKLKKILTFFNILAKSLLSNQKDIVEEAFAGLDVYKAFEEEKAAILNEQDDDPVEVQDLPGWVILFILFCFILFICFFLGFLGW